MTTDGSYRMTRFAFMAWASMIAMLAIMAAVKWTRPGGDPDISGPFEMALTFTIVAAVPFALLAGCILAPCALIADRIVRGRMSAVLNALIGALFAVPAGLAFLVGNWLLFGAGKRSFGEYFARVRSPPDTLIGLLIVFAVGGVVISLAMRHRGQVPDRR